jgi:hypothetical protein
MSSSRQVPRHGDNNGANFDPYELYIVSSLNFYLNSDGLLRTKLYMSDKPRESLPIHPITLGKKASAALANTGPMALASKYLIIFVRTTSALSDLLFISNKDRIRGLHGLYS